ncbi:MAG: hypothetical protein KJ884_04845 [Gammaproteobacteria bacterium]|uniref:Putative tail tape measure protein n=1 Tax=viral metagenome TaxID=1070528 RepID=A0A6M3J875_9ZZZZ|nr:hypothetical protein [Gammaproteobacteria bacterium]MBU1492220.1 hypothetical protein [Gammaproteobacteria bacterium]MBU2066791.1 hypothetical protein [Gammaproteobacteria bacterium]MBU2137393.1 hypothetical protein [Gammaproteobacteria bacterium]MBU2215046.1 hypothetical protein [Gammaproteobacteria bacterium]
MSKPRIMLGGVEVVALAGAALETLEPAGGSVLTRMSDGALVKQQHWNKLQGSISGDGWLPPGLDGLDYSQPLELRSTKIQSINGAGLVYELPGLPRPDYPATGLAQVGRIWVSTDCEVVDGVATLAALPGAVAYRVCWLPVFMVFCERPSETQNDLANTHAWSISWLEA